MGRLKGKVAIVTGSAQSMGASHVRKFIHEGAKVVIADINEDKGTALAKELGDNALFVRQDVTDEADWKNLIKKTEETFGPVNILVNNAEVTIKIKSIENTTLDNYNKILQINQVSVFLGMKSVIDSMRKAGGGSIINISSMSGLVGGAIGYTDTKFAIRGMTKATALEYSPQGIRVNSVHPGVTETRKLVEEGSKEQVDELIRKIPMQRIAKEEEISNLVLYLASDESSYSTGSEFVVDGGLTAE